METNHKKEYLFIVLLVLVVAGIGFISSSRYQHMQTDYPAKASIVKAEDFVLTNTQPNLIIGKSSWEEVQKCYPEGKTLGMSTVYRPNHIPAIFTFTKKSNLLTKVDIQGPGLPTARGVEVGDSYDKLVKTYGSGFIRSYAKNDPATFDAIYGSNEYIVFHISQERVEKIVLSSSVQK